VIEISFVPETMAANILLEKFIQEKKSMAVVVDEFGGLSGMLTIEDIIEEIFGEIEDEHDTIELIDKQINEQEYIFSGRLEIDFINEKYKLKIPESEDYETLAGFIFHHHENIPKLNERIDIDRFEIKILKVTSTKIDLVHLKLILS
jgi:CBS domain containing-hemolysin-like protein